MSTLFDPIQQLKLSDTFYNWWETTNSISEALNPLNIYDVAAGPGITVTRITDGVAVLSVNVGCGLRHDANVSLTLDIQNLPEKTIPDEEDNYIIELANSTNITTDATDCETFRRVEATNILPYTVSGDHDFVGGVSSSIDISTTNFTVDSSNTHLKASSIKIGNVSSTARSAISSVGFRIDALDEDPSLVYRGDLLAWYTNQNIGLSYDQAFVSEGPSGSTYAKFNFSPKGATQANTEINMLLGTRTTEIITTDTDESITLRAIDSTNAFDVSYITNSGARTPLFYGKYDSGGSYVLFNVGGRIYIEDIQNSTQFLTSSDYTEHKVPLTNTNGIVDYKFTNRFTSTSYDGSIVVGDVVRWNASQFVRSQANSESNSEIFGIVERISGGKIWIALTGLFNTSGLTSGSLYYLSQTLPGKMTTTKPTTGLVKPVMFAYATTIGLITSSSSSSSPSFANVQISGGALVDANSVSDTLTLIPGANITIEKNTNNEIEISAASLSQADYFKIIQGDFGSITASGEDTATIVGQNGIQTFATGGNTVFINGANGYSSVQIIGVDTNELDYTLEAESANDVLYLRSGTGISITSNSNNDILFEATGLSVPADGSITNNKLDDMVPFSIKGAQSSGRPIDIFDVSGSLSTSYTVSGTGDFGDPKIYTDDVTSQTYTSVQSVSGNTVLAWAPPTEIAGYVFGRYVNELGQVSNITTLGRQELRSIIGASPSGFLEENSNLFNSWYLYESDQETEINQTTASAKNGKLIFVEGNNISLSRVVAVGPDNEIGIRIDAADTAGGFQNIINTRTGDFFTTGETAGVIEIDDNDAVGVDVSTNLGLVFYIKPESITNNMLANMPVNTVKASINNTDDPNPIDLLIGENQILGRISGQNIKSLTSTEVKQILGLTSSNYFKSIKINNSAGSEVSGSQISASSLNETFVLQEGDNISISRVGSTNTYSISSTGGSTGGLNRITVSDIGVNGDVQLDNASSLTIGLVNPSDPISGSLYENIDLVPTVDGRNIRVDFDLALMPQGTIKTANNIAAFGGNTTATSTTRNEVTGYAAANLQLGLNSLLYRQANGSLCSATLREVAGTTNGLPYYTVISNGSTNVAVTGNGPHVLSVAAGARTTVVPTYNGSTGTSTFTVSSQTVVSSDTAPSLGGNLDVSTFSFTRTGSNILAFSSAPLNTRYFTISSAATGTGVPTLTSTSTEASVNVDLGLSPLRGGAVLIGGTSPSIKSASTLSITALSTSTTAKHILLESGAGGIVTIGTLAVNKHLAIQTAAAGYDVRITGVSNTNYCAFRFDGNNTGIITNNTTGNLILVSGATGLTTIPTSGSTRVQFNSDILLASKTITASDKNITINVESNDFSGALKLQSTNKSGFYRVKNGSITVPIGNTGGTISGTGGMSSGYLDVINYSTSTEKAIKYFMYIQNSLVPAESALVEFNVIINGTNFRSLEIINTMVQSDSSELFTWSEENQEAGIVVMTPVTGTGAVGGVEQLPLLPDCAVNLPSLGATEVGITLNKCMQGTYNITLHKMSIQA
jgi:hypothetical protein